MTRKSDRDHYTEITSQLSTAPEGKVFLPVGETINSDLRRWDKVQGVHLQHQSQKCIYIHEKNSYGKLATNLVKSIHQFIRKIMKEQDKYPSPLTGYSNILFKQRSATMNIMSALINRLVLTSQMVKSVSS